MLTDRDRLKNITIFVRNIRKSIFDSLVVFTHKFVNLRRKAPLRQSGLLFLNTLNTHKIHLFLKAIKWYDENRSS